jgi:serine/threonine-protein kinase
MTPSDSKSPIAIGEVLAGKYRVDRVLGTGGMGVVVAAHHLDLDEPVAIKFLRPNVLENETAVGRFLREARAAAKIKSEHVARVYDVGRMPSGAPYLVMEYLDGDDLGTIVKGGGPLTVEQAVEHILEACEAMAAAHGRGIVHRDIKPANLFLVRREDGSRVLKVIDFGISKVRQSVAEDSQNDDQSMTRSDAIIGSPLYMAPEQMHSAKHVDPRADVWSLGATLFTLLTGAPPFRGASMMGIIESMLRGLTPPRELVATIPIELDALICRCLSRDPSGRPADVAELADALAPFAPPRALHLTERIRGTLRASGSLRSGERQAMSSSPDPTPPDAVWPTAVATEPMHGRPPIESPTQQAWTDTRPRPARSRLLLLLPVAGFLIGVGWWWTTRTVPPVEAEPSATQDATEAPAAPPPSETMELPVASAEPSAAPSASVSTPGPMRRPVPTPSAKSKDLWSHPF